jgi:3-hydroxybutyryl-CoA dehydrogenase
MPGIMKIAVLGAGTMGHGIAYAAGSARFETTLFDISPQALEAALASIRRIADRAVERGAMPEGDREGLFARLFTTTSLGAAVRDAELVIEAVPEQIDLKIATFSEVQQHAPADAVLATNTSALSLSEMAAVLADPSRLVGMHFFNPVPRMALIEIVRTAETGERAIAAAEEVARRMGKETVLVRESPGFVTSRINAMIGNEAFYMLQEGVASARDIDKALKLGPNHPMGPFELVDLVGLDTRLSILRYLHRTLGEKFRPCPLLEAHVEAGRLGRKVGRGVYEYDEPRRHGGAEPQ